jgi:hypothetical protein
MKHNIQENHDQLALGGNKPLQEWKTFESKDTITWVFDEDSFSPVAKILKNPKT